MSKETPKKDVRLALGPNLFNWEAKMWRDFYFRIADEAPVDTVYLGETICFKRMSFFEPYLAEVVERLQNAHKQVVHSTLTLVMTRQERKALAAVAREDAFLIEANDVSALGYVSGRAHVIGPAINTYNEDTISFFAERGATHICLPPELSLQSIQPIAARAHEVGMTVEVFGYGRLPLAVSARCYHARVHDRSRDGCLFVCDQDPDGLPVTTMDGEDFLAINGIQTLSHACHNVIGDLAALVGAGVDALRLSPHSGDMVAIAKSFRAVLDGTMDPGQALETMEAQSFGAPFANGFIHKAPGVEWVLPDVGPA